MRRPRTELLEDAGVLADPDDDQSHGMPNVPQRLDDQVDAFPAVQASRQKEVVAVRSRAKRRGSQSRVQHFSVQVVPATGAQRLRSRWRRSCASAPAAGRRCRDGAQWPAVATGLAMPARTPDRTCRRRPGSCAGGSRCGWDAAPGRSAPWGNHRIVVRDVEVVTAQIGFLDRLEARFVSGDLDQVGGSPVARRAAANP
jgi:hypothetical protein